MQLDKDDEVYVMFDDVNQSDGGKMFEDAYNGFTGKLYTKL